MTLPKPKHIWWNGQVRDWADASVHVTTETAIRGVNVFEGVMAYKAAGRDAHAVIALDEHLARLARSAALLDLSMPYTTDEFARGVADLVRAEPTDDDLYIRPTVFLESGGYTADPARMSLGGYITAYPRSRGTMRSVRLATTPVVRVDDAAFPTQAKSGAVYSAFRLARIAAGRLGADEPVLLNARGTVAESAGAAIVAVVDGAVVSPPAADGALESITRGCLARLLREHDGRELELRSLRPDDLRAADELLLCGTLDEVVAVETLDGVAPRHPGHDLATRLFDLYRDLCTATEPDPVRTMVSWSGATELEGTTP